MDHRLSKALFTAVKQSDSSYQFTASVTKTTRTGFLRNKKGWSDFSGTYDGNAKTIPDHAVRSLEVFESSCSPPLQSRASDWQEMQQSVCLSWRRGGGWEGWLGLLCRFAATAGRPDRAPVRSLHRKATRLLHGCQELLIELLVWLVRRDVDPVEAAKMWKFVTSKRLQCVFKWLFYLVRIS